MTTAGRAQVDLWISGAALFLAVLLLAASSLTHAHAHPRASGTEPSPQTIVDVSAR